ncbi:MAG TPA: integrin alpha [Acidobacteriota bacterium]|nr:integrin alpha [Acidobacteriota bacterium]
MLSRFSAYSAMIGVVGVLVMVQVPHAACPPSASLSGELDGDRFGEAVAVIGDVNHDGSADLLVGAPRNGAAGDFAGRVYLYSGTDGTLLDMQTGQAAGDNFGAEVASAGDVNADGYDDYIIGAPYHDAVASDAGRAYVFSGTDGALLYTFDGEGDNDWFGESVAGAGDVNVDGYADLIVGAPQYGSPARGKAYVFSGRDGSLLHQFVAANLYAYLGIAVAAAGDVDADGFPDLLVGAPVVNLFTGEAYVYSGQTGALLHTFASGHADGQFGRAVAGAGDVDADGFDDILVGAWSDDTYGDNAGRAFVYSGQTGDLLHELTRPDGSTKPMFGVSVGATGDWDDDGHDDVLVGCSGGTFVFSGTDGTVLTAVTIQPVTTFFGTAVASGGDINGDGHADILVGQFDAEAGRAYTFSCAAACDCDCHADPECDGVCNVLDVVRTVGTAFRGQPAPLDTECLKERTDVDCNGLTNVLDVVRVVNVAFRSGDPVVEFSNPCP